MRWGDITVATGGGLRRLLAVSLFRTFDGFTWLIDRQEVARQFEFNSLRHRVLG